MQKRPPTVTRSDAIALATLALLLLLLFAPGLAGHLLTVRDMPGITLPSRAFYRQSVLSGELPLWNPLVALGVPTLAVPIHGSLYPGQLLLLVGSLATGVALTWAVHMWVGAAGGYALARQVGCRPSVAVIAALVFGISGYAVSMSWNGEKTLPHAFLPWMAWTVYRAARAPSARASVLAALPPALVCLAGDPFLLLDGALLAVPFAFAAVPGGRAPLDVAKDVVRAIALPLLLGALFAAPALVPAFVLRSGTSRAVSLSLQAAEAWSLHPVRWLELFVSRPLGDPLGPTAEYAGGVYADAPEVQALPWAVSLYLGAGTVALATAARGRLASWLTTASAFALLLALGKHLPVYAVVRTVVPMLSLARYPEKHVVVMCYAAGILSAMGTERLLSGLVDARGPALVAFAGLLAALMFAPPPLQDPVFGGAAQSALILALLCGAFVVARRDERLVFLPTLVIAIDLVFAAVPLFAWTEGRGLPRSTLAEGVLAGHGALPPRIFRWNPSRTTDFTLLPLNAPNLYGIAAVPGEDSAATAGLDELAFALASSGPRTWEILRTTHTIAPSENASKATEPAAQWKVVKGPERPRAWMVGRIEALGGAAALDRLRSPDFDVEGAAVVALPADSPPTGRLLADLSSAASAPQGPCAVERYEPTTVELRCSSTASALVVLADGFADGWTATVDGVRQPIVLTDMIYRGVAVSKGEHCVRFRYEPPGLAFGGLVALLGALVSALAIVRERRRSAAVQEA